MPIVEVAYAADVSDGALGRVAELLPDLVAEAVDCPEEPWDGPARAGDIEIRFRPRSRFDVGDLRMVVEVRTKRVDGRVHDAQRRADLIKVGLSGVGVEPLGVWLILHEGAWSQT